MKTTLLCSRVLQWLFQFTCLPAVYVATTSLPVRFASVPSMVNMHSSAILTGTGLVCLGCWNTDAKDWLTSAISYGSGEFKTKILADEGPAPWFIDDYLVSVRKDRRVLH